MRQYVIFFSLVLVLAPHLSVAGDEALYTRERLLKNLWNKVKETARRIFRPRDTLPGKVQVKMKQRTGIFYVALGDSYAAGVGSGGGNLGARAGDLDACCSRNANAYPVLLAHMLGASAKLDFRACMGAKARGSANTVQAQMKHASRNAVLVTVTVGGNDMGFADVLTSCLGGHLTRRRCLRQIRRARANIWHVVARRTRRLQRDLQVHFPKAIILFTGYPIPFPWSKPDDPVCKFPVSVRREVNRLINTLNQVLKMNVDNFVDVDFSGREICKRSSWIHNTLKPAIRTLRYRAKPKTCSARSIITQHIAGAYHLQPGGQMHYAKNLYAWYQSRK